MMRVKFAPLLRPTSSYNKPRLETSKIWQRIPAKGLRTYASQTSTGTSRKQVTLANDDGRVQWRDLSIREKAARTTQQTFNFGLIITGIIMTVRGSKNLTQNKQLIQRRVELFIFCTPKSFRQTARPAISIAPLTESVPILELLSCWAQATRFGLSESLRPTSGREQGQLRK